MKAMIYSGYGSPEVIQSAQVDIPVPKKDEVLIQVHSSAVGPSDCAFRKGDPFLVKLMYGLRKPKYAIGGTELAGVIAAVGEDVQQFKPGDRVLAMSNQRFGAYAEFVSLPVSNPLTKLPDTVTYEEAVAVCDGAATALTFLRDKAKLQPGQRIAVNGASGAVGIYAVQLAKYYGAEVTGICSAANRELVQQAGADVVVDYRFDDFTRSDRMYDVIFDAVGKRTFAECRSALSANGVYMTTVPNLSELLQVVRTSLRPGRKALFAAAGLMQNEANLQFLLQLLVAGQLVPIIDRRYPLEQLAAAHAYVDTERKRGNVLLTY